MSGMKGRSSRYGWSVVAKVCLFGFIAALLAVEWLPSQWLPSWLEYAVYLVLAGFVALLLYERAQIQLAGERAEKEREEMLRQQERKS